AQMFIKNNYHKKIKLNDVAKSVYLSPNYFSTVFKDISGDSFSSFLQKTRINAAKKMLIETNLTIKEIVYAIGMVDYNYFNRIFRRLEGLPPVKFRESHQHEIINRIIIQT
ncbi:MAG: helix-turn-helix transcriptional regulator, partial [Spirochaetaceae bacterium]|nr:helix-turn-helix transcriptional regulator [Spirochaetaceae bacterium]